MLPTMGGSGPLWAIDVAPGLLKSGFRLSTTTTINTAQTRTCESRICGMNRDFAGLMTM